MLLPGPGSRRALCSTILSCKICRRNHMCCNLGFKYEAHEMCESCASPADMLSKRSGTRGRQGMTEEGGSESTFTQKIVACKHEFRQVSDEHARLSTSTHDRVVSLHKCLCLCIGPARVLEMAPSAPSDTNRATPWKIRGICL